MLTTELRDKLAAWIVWLMATWILVSCTPENIDDREPLVADVYILAGQSNMLGYGDVDQLAPSLREPIPGTYIFHGQTAWSGDERGGLGMWRPLTAGHGGSFRSTKRRVWLSDQFGPELGFASFMVLSNPDSTIAIIKYASPGTALADTEAMGSWSKGTEINQRDHAFRTIQLAMESADINSDGIRDELTPTGIIWMQGESDALSDQAAAQAYRNNLYELMTEIRQSLGAPALPVVIGQIRSGENAEGETILRFQDEVRSAQASFVEQDVCAELSTITDAVEMQADGLHYTSEAYLQMGRAFAESALRLQASCH